MDAVITAQIISLSLHKQLLLNLHRSRSYSRKLYWYHLCWHTTASLETGPGYPQIGSFGLRGERPAAPGVTRGALRRRAAQGLRGGPTPTGTMLCGFLPPKILTPPRDHRSTASSPHQICLFYTITFILRLLKTLISSLHPTIHIFTQLRLLFGIRDTNMLEMNRDCVSLLETRHLLVLHLWGSNTTLLTCAAANRSGKQCSACSFGNRGLLKKPHTATFFLYQHIPIGFVVMLIVILGSILFAPLLWKTIQQARGSSRKSCRCSVCWGRATVRWAPCKWKKMKILQSWTGSARHLWELHVNFYKLSKVKGSFWKVNFH